MQLGHGGSPYFVCSNLNNHLNFEAAQLTCSGLDLMTCGGIVILAECAQNARVSGSKHFNQTHLDATWRNTITLLQLLGKDHARARGYLEHLVSLRDHARSASSRTIPLYPPPYEY